MGIVNLKSSGIGIELDISKTSPNVEDYIIENKTFIGGDYTDDASIRIGKLKVRDSKDLVSVVDQNNYFTIPKGYYPIDNNITIPSIKDYTSNGVQASQSDIFTGYNAYINGNLVQGTGQVPAITNIQGSPVDSGYRRKTLTLSWSYPSNAFISGIAICGKTSSSFNGPYDSQIYMGSGTSKSIDFTSSQTYYIAIYPYCIIDGSYKWYNKNGTIIPSYTNSYQIYIYSGSSGGGGGCGDSCGCNNNCSHVSYGVFC